MLYYLVLLLRDPSENLLDKDKELYDSIREVLLISQDVTYFVVEINVLHECVHTRFTYKSIVLLPSTVKGLNYKENTSTT